MKYLIIAGVFVLGVSLGYVIGTQSSGDTPSDNLLADNSVEDTESDGKNNKHHQTKNDFESDSDLDESLADSLEMEINDSTTVFAETDSISTEDDLSISREKLVKSVKLPIIYLSEEEEKDSVIKDMLGIEEIQSKNLVVEFWESPLNFEGYKLSKKKLIIYGLSSQFDYKMYRNDGTYYLACQNLYYKMKETQNFLPFVEVAKNVVFND